MLTKRQRLIDRISEDHAVTLLAAPTGFGKTTALAVWLEERFASKNNHAATIAWVEGSKVAALKKSDELLTVQIGRASCRERGQNQDEAGSRSSKQTRNEWERREKPGET